MARSADHIVAMNTTNILGICIKKNHMQSIINFIVDNFLEDKLMTAQAYPYFIILYIIVFSLMLGFCVFFRHGVEHCRYILLVLSFFFFITNKKYLKGLLTSHTFLLLISFFLIALTSLIFNSLPLSRIDEAGNWIIVFIFGYIASILTQNNNIKFIYIIPITLIITIILFPGFSGAGWSHLNILSTERLNLYFQGRANHLGLICAIFAFSTIYVGALIRGRTRIILFFLSGICVFLLFRTASRASFLGTAIVFSGWLIWKAQKMPKKIAISLFFAGLCSISILFYSPLKETRTLRYVTTGLSRDISVLQRFFTWNVAYTNFAQRPLIGKGFDSFADQYKEEIQKYKNDPAYREKFPHTIQSTNNAHNFFLHFLSETGIMGLVVILWFWAAVVLKGFQHHNPISPPVAGMFLISLIAFQMNMSMYGSQISTILFAFAGLSSCPITDEYEVALKK